MNKKRETSMEIRRIIKVLLRNQPILLGVRNQPKA